MSLTRQIGAVIGLSLRSLPQRRGAALVVIVGIAGVVAVLLSVMAMAVGFARTVADTGSPERVIVLASGALSEVLSTIPREAVANVLSAPGIARDPDGKPIASAETLVQIQRPRRGAGKRVNVTLRGVGTEAGRLRPEIVLISGRMFQPAVHELIVGRSAAEEYDGLAVGRHLTLQNGDWVIVGEFRSIGSGAHDSELMTDTDTLLSAYRRSGYQSVTARLEGAGAFDRMRQAIANDPTLHVDVRLEQAYFAAQSRGLSRLLRFIAYFIGGIMAAGALFSAINVMYATVSARATEIATLRAVGFSAVAVVLSVLAEALLLALGGALLGATVAWLFFSGHTISLLSGPQGSTAFALTVTPALLILGISWACVIGLLGGLLPAIRAARLPVASALRASA